MKRAALALVIALTWAAGLIAKDTPRLRVFVTAREQDGFVDVTSASHESMEDLSNALKKSSHVEVVSDKDRADLIFRLTARNASSVESGSTTALVPVGGILVATGGPKYFWTYSVLADVEIAGAVVHQVKGLGKSYKDSAKAAVQDLTLWIEANDAQIRARAVPVP